MHGHLLQTPQEANSDDDREVMNEITMTPLVDVMLVLLIICIITVPVMKHAIQVEQPSATAQGAYFWNQNAVTQEALGGILEAEARKEPQPELHIRCDKAVRYAFVAQAMASAKQACLR